MKNQWRKSNVNTNIRKWNEGEDLKVVYIIEHTGNDKEVEEINFSNINKVEANDLEMAIKFIGIYQDHGYHNIALCQTIYNKHGKHIIEDHAVDIEWIANTGQTRRINELERSLQVVSDELTLYKEFIKKYKSEKLFQEFTDNQLNKLT